MRPSRFQLRFLVWIFIFSLAFDFKDQESGGTYSQYIMTGLAWTSACLIFAFNGLPLIKGMSRNFRYALFALGLFFAIVYFSHVVNGSSTYYFWRVVLPYVLLVLGFFSACTIIEAGFSVSMFLNMLTRACIIAAIFRPIFAVVYLNVAIEEARYQILTTSAPYLIAFGMAHLILARRSSWLGVCALVVASACVLLSVTRSYLFTVLFCLIGALICFSVQSRALKLNSIKRIVAESRKFVALAIVGIVAVAIVTWFRPDIFDQWDLRMHQREVVGTESDPTLMTREAEIQGMFAQMATPEDWLIGKGFGAGYFWSSDYRSELVDIVTLAAFDDEINVAGHNFWVYQIFGAGILGALSLFYFIGLSFLLSYRQAKRVAPFFSRQPELAVPFLAICGFLGQTFTSTPLAERFGALVFGICLGLGYVAKNPPRFKPRLQYTWNDNYFVQADNARESFVT